MRRWAVIAFLALHFVLLLLAGFLPYPVNEQNRRLSFAPPTPMSWLDADGYWTGPTVGRLIRSSESPNGYRLDTSEPYAVRFFSRYDTDAPGTLRLWTTDSPSGAHLWGTDRYGRDVFSRALHGARLSLFTGILAGTLAICLGLMIGAACVLWGGWVDSIGMRLAELTWSLPWLYLLIAFRSFVPLDTDPEKLFVWTILLVGLLAWPYPARLARGTMLAAMQEDYIQASIGFGVSRKYLFFKHLLPHTRDALLTHWTLLVPQCVLAEVALSFFGLGSGAGVPSLGNMLADLTEVGGAMTKPWMFSPAIVLGLAILSYHLLAEALHRSRGD